MRIHFKQIPKSIPRPGAYVELESAMPVDLSVIRPVSLGNSAVMRPNGSAKYLWSTSLPTINGASTIQDALQTNDGYTTCLILQTACGFMLTFPNPNIPAGATISSLSVHVVGQSWENSPQPLAISPSCSVGGDTLTTAQQRTKNITFPYGASYTEAVATWTPSDTLTPCTPDFVNNLTLYLSQGGYAPSKCISQLWVEVPYS